MKDSPLQSTPLQMYEKAYRLENNSLSNDFFRLLVESLDDYAVFTLDSNGQIMTWNQAAARIFGYTEPEVIGKIPNFILQLEEQKNNTYAKQLRAALRKGKFHTEGWYVCKNTSTIWANGFIFPLKSSKGKIFGFTQVLRELTDQKMKTEERLRFEEIIKSSDDAIIGKDLNGYVTNWNRSAERMYKWKAKEIIGKHISLIFPDDRKTELKEIMDRIARRERIQRYITQRKRKDGTIFDVSITISPIADEANHIIGASTITRDITDEKKKEDQLKEQAHLLHHAHDAFILQDKEGNILLWNEGAVHLYGYTETEALGKNLHTLLQTKFPIPLNKIHYYLQTKQQWKGELLHTKKNGDIIIVDTRWSLLDKAKYKVLEVTRDVTDRKQAEENLKFLSDASRILSSSLDYEKTLKSIARLAVPRIADWCGVDMLNEKGDLELVAIAHKDPRKVKWARALRKLNPVDMNAPSGVPNVLRTGKPELYPHITDAMLVATAKNEEQLKLTRELGLTAIIIAPLCVENKCIGTIEFVSTESKKHFNEKDLTMAQELASRASLAIENARLYKAAQQEIKERIKTEQKLIESETKFKALVDANIIGVMRANLYGDILDTNDAFLSIIGYTKEEIDDHNINLKNLTPPEYREIDQKALHELLKKHVTIPWEKEFIKKDGSQVPVIIGAVLLNRKKGEVMAFILDITERKKLEHRKDEFIGIASHELKTPLTSIKGYTQILERIIQQMGDDQLKLYLKKTNTYIDRLNSLIADLLDVSKIQAGKLQMNYTEFDFDVLVSDAIESMQHTNTKHKIVKEGSVHKKIWGDRHRLEQVLTNLLSNAIKYSPSSNSILVRVSSTNNEVKVEVQDFGVGIPKSKITKLFDRFYRVEETSKQFSGLGIGLYISAEIVTRHKGNIWAESKRNKGSTFYFTLPITNQSHE